MTHSSDFKDLVRARMRATGQPYTAARADLLREHDDAAAPGSSLRAPRASSSVPEPFPAAQPTPTGDASAPTAPDAASSEQWRRAEAEYRRMLGRFVQDGRVVSVPARRRARVFVLLHLLSLIPAGRTYSESEINEILRTTVADVAFWRRELVNYGYLEREPGVYWLPTEVPERPVSIRQETPEWEALWLPTHLRNRTR
ncbi:DUF2087 domain-containing protein [Kocuria tytonis]|uniref:DUF2087 domain-containing protein n=1 Tax=Kocuria tytonis TaxID=2054280 RepID=A0A495A9W3_9MICC|nr:DUF2087 domain-containing protein [Kocuria tytonis]RKQ36829.1 DUF2087 domain-containing protein [Kocuria tytonis]